MAAGAVEPEIKTELQGGLRVGTCVRSSSGGAHPRMVVDMSYAAGPVEQRGNGAGARHLARLVLVAFLFTFSASRTLVLLIMTHRLPDLYVHLGGTHIHHLNEGIFLLAGAGAYLLFATPHGRRRRIAALVYGIGLALTFDEFGMWLYLNDRYWQRASFDAIIVIAGVLALALLAPRLRSLRFSHWATAVLLAITLVLFGLLLRESLVFANARLTPFLQRLEEGEPR